jgi:hypothetical protein
MTVHGKPGKPTPGFPLFPPTLEIAARFPHSHRLDDLFLYIGEANTPSPKNQQLRVGQIKPPKWAKGTCQTQVLWNSLCDPQSDVYKAWCNN